MFGDEKQEMPNNGEPKQVPYRELYPIAEAAVLLGISDTTAYRMADAGTLPTRRLGGRRLVARAELLAMIEALPIAETQKRPDRRKAAAVPA